jgi:hypothetical protein
MQIHIEGRELRLRFTDRQKGITSMSILELRPTQRLLMLTELIGHKPEFY